MKKAIYTSIAILACAIPGICGAGGGSTLPEPSTDLLLGAVVLGFGAFAVYKSRKKKV